MKIKLSPRRMDESIAAVVSGDDVTINDIKYDFSALLEGESLPAQDVNISYFLGDISRVEGEIHLTLVLPHAADAPDETRFPTAQDTPLTIVAGAVPFPPYSSMS